MKILCVLLLYFLHSANSAICYNGTCNTCISYGSGECGWCEDVETEIFTAYGACFENKSSCSSGLWSTELATCPQHCLDSPYESSLCAVPDKHDATIMNFGGVYKCSIWNGLEGDFTTTQTDTFLFSNIWKRWKHSWCDFDSITCARAYYAYECAGRCKSCGKTSYPCPSMCAIIYRECPKYLTCSSNRSLSCYQSDTCALGGVGPDFNAWMKDGFPLDWTPASSSSSSSSIHHHVLSSSVGITGVVFFLLFVIFQFV